MQKVFIIRLLCAMILSVLVGCGSGSLETESQSTSEEQSLLPSAPTKVTVSPGVCTGGSGGCALTYQINWPAVRSVPETTTYNVYRAITLDSCSQGGCAEPRFIRIASVASPTYTDTGLAGSTCTYEITAINSIGEGPRSARASTNSLVPPAPADVHVNILQCLVAPCPLEIAWAAVTSAPATTSYNVYRAEPRMCIPESKCSGHGPFSLVANVTTTTCLVDPSLFYGYTFAVAAVNSNGEGPLSSEIALMLL